MPDGDEKDFADWAAAVSAGKRWPPEPSQRDARLAHNGLMDSYILRPGGVSAVQWTGENAADIARILRIPDGDEVFAIAVQMAAQDGRLRADYHGKPLAADTGDWYVRNPDGHAKVMTDDDFRFAYQR